ncbi:D-ribose pyranase [Aquella oligotrophica]|uniref:D-ribose pyranase n=1 Tax=Aquella oligotrophica TaxID=2067065 RepID=A0A2I7N940_9NEIS|nr:D-ribose pyranase [Aquella oligotrophica]AUR52976.1 D-ribose pyranase [Aquella oligotrophica]
MNKYGILNSEICKVLADLGHTDMVVIADCGLPIPEGVKKIDLALKVGTPGFIEVVELLAQYMQVEKATIAREIHGRNPVTYESLQKTLGASISFEELSHEEFKLLTHKARAIIRTGEATPYANVILHAGVIF